MGGVAIQIDRRQRGQPDVFPAAGGGEGGQATRRRSGRRNTEIIIGVIIVDIFAADRQAGKDASAERGKIGQAREYDHAIMRAGDVPSQIDLGR